MSLLDAIFIVVTVAFFGVALSYVVGCDRLAPRSKDDR